MVTSRLDRAQLAARDNHERGVASRSGHAFARALSVKLGHKADADSARCRSHWPSPPPSPDRACAGASVHPQPGRASARGAPPYRVRSCSAPLLAARGRTRARARDRARGSRAPSFRQTRDHLLRQRPATHPPRRPRLAPPNPPSRDGARSVARRDAFARTEKAAKTTPRGLAPTPNHRSLRSTDPSDRLIRPAPARARLRRRRRARTPGNRWTVSPSAQADLGRATPGPGWLAVTMGGGEACAQSMGIDVCACVPSLITLTCTSPGARAPRTEIT